MAVKPVSLRKMEEKQEYIRSGCSHVEKSAADKPRTNFKSKGIEESEELEMDVLDELPDIKPEDYEEKEKVTTKAMNEFLEGEVNLGCAGGYRRGLVTLIKSDAVSKYLKQTKDLYGINCFLAWLMDSIMSKVQIKHLINFLIELINVKIFSLAKQELILYLE
ncbi:MAG: hypothetical protein Ct9H300mP29_9080 [Candidatus Neomarinimicrobiota bacterium]|nr:MAG: hypothetical protein Ct9H300mP29_9080 [Candidatus Neomarinimicrobiota bacterium]